MRSCILQMILSKGRRIKAANITQAALRAEGAGTAYIFSQANQQSVIFIKETGISREISHEKGLVFNVTGIFRSQSNAADNTAGISINNKDWFVSGIKNYRVGGLRPDTIYRKKLLAYVVNITGEKLTEVVIIVFIQPLNKGFKFPGFGVVISGGVDKAGDFCPGKFA